MISRKVGSREIIGSISPKSALNSRMKPISSMKTQPEYPRAVAMLGAMTFKRETTCLEWRKETSRRPCVNRLVSSSSSSPSPFDVTSIPLSAATSRKADSSSEKTCETLCGSSEPTASDAETNVQSTPGFSSIVCRILNAKKVVLPACRRQRKRQTRWLRIHREAKRWKAVSFTCRPHPFPSRP